MYIKYWNFEVDIAEADFFSSPPPSPHTNPTPVPLYLHLTSLLQLVRQHLNTWQAMQQAGILLVY
jgi:hypothetical protein